MEEALEVVGVLSHPGPPRCSSGELLLDPAEDLEVDERFVGAEMLGAVPLHDPDVDRVGEDLGQPLPGDRFGLAVTASSVAKAAVGQLLRPALEGPLAGGAGLEAAVMSEARSASGTMWATWCPAITSRRFR